MKNYLNLLQKSALFSNLDKPEIESALNCLSPNIASYKKNQYIARTDESIDCIGFLRYSWHYKLSTLWAIAI